MGCIARETCNVARVDWEDFRFVLALTRTGSLSAASKELGVVRTTVGRRVDALEESLGVRLFDRTPDGFVPTGAGQDLADAAGRVEAEVLSVQGRILGRDAALQGALRVTTVDFLFEAYVDVFAAFLDRYPGIELTATASYEQVSLRRREADVALRLSDAPAPHLVGRRLCSLDFGIYGSRALVDRIGADAELRDFPWVREDERTENGPEMAQWLEANAPGARIAMRFASYPVLRASVTAGLGIHPLPCIEADADPNLVALGPPRFSRDLWALTLPELRTNSRVRAFMDHVYEGIGGAKAAPGS